MDMLIGMGIRHLWGNQGKESMSEIAVRLGFNPVPLVSSGENYQDAPQTMEIIEKIREGKGNVGGMIGFSGGAWCMRNATRHHDYKALPKEWREAFEANLIAIGAPVSQEMFPEGSKLTVYNIPATDHLEQPRAVLAMLMDNDKASDGVVV